MRFTIGPNQCSWLAGRYVYIYMYMASRRGGGTQKPIPLFCPEIYCHTGSITCASLPVYLPDSVLDYLYTYRYRCSCWSDLQCVGVHHTWTVTMLTEQEVASLRDLIRFPETPDAGQKVAKVTVKGNHL